MAILFNLTNENSADSTYPTVTVSAEYDECVTWPVIAAGFFQGLKAIGYSFNPATLEESIQDLINEGICE